MTTFSQRPPSELLIPGPDRELRRHLLLLVPIAMFVMYFNLGSGSLKDFDEARYAELSREMTLSGKVYTLEHNYTYYLNKPPLAVWATALMYKLFGVSELTTRLFAATCSVATILVSYLLGRSILGGRIALTGALLLATTPMFLKYGRLGMMDAPLTGFLTLGLFSYWKSRENPKHAAWIGLFFCCAALTKSVVSLLIPGVILAHCFLTWDFSVLRNRRFWISMICGLVIALSWFFMQYRLFGELATNRLYYHVVTRAVTPLEGNTGFSYPGKYTLENTVWGVLGTGSILWLIWRFVAKKANPGLLLLLAWTLVVFALFMTAKTKIYWYILPAVPAMALTSGWLLHSMLRPRLVYTGLCLIPLAVGAHVWKTPWLVTMDYSPGLRKILPRIQPHLENEDTLYLDWLSINTALFYTHKKCLRVDDQAGALLLRESTRRRGRRLCLVRTWMIPSLKHRLTDECSVRILEQEGRVSLVEILHENPISLLAPSAVTSEMERKALPGTIHAAVSAHSANPPPRR